MGPRSETVGQTPAILPRGAAIAIGERARFYGVEARACLQAYNGARIIIGDRALINSGATILAAQSVTIGDDLKLGSFAYITDTDSHEVVPGSGVRVQPLTIGDNVWIGRGAIVLPGCDIGDGAVVAAGAVVTKPVPAHTLVAGNPARPVRSLPPTSAARR